MLFNIENSVIDNMKLGEENCISVCVKLAHSYRAGKILLVASFNALKYLKSTSLIDPVAKGIYADLFRRYSEIGQYMEFFSKKVNIFFDNQNIIQERDGDIYISTLFMNNSSLEQKPVLLVENLLDTKLYDLIIRYFCKIKNIGINYTYEPVSGGGSTINEQYKSYKEDRDRICLCILDSDRIYAEMKTVGSTANKVVEIHEKNSSVLCKYHILLSREIENLLPVSIYKNMITNTLRTNSISIIEKIIKNKPSDIRYLDMKEGIKVKALYSKFGDHFVEFWTKIFQEIDININCVRNCNDNCNCFIIYGFGSKFLDEFIDFVKDMNIEYIISNLDSYLHEEWNKLGEDLLTWFCASRKKSTYGSL